MEQPVKPGHSSPRGSRWTRKLERYRIIRRHPVRLARQTGVSGASGATLLRFLSSLRSRCAGRAPPIDHAKTPLQRFGQFAKGRKRVGRQPALPLQAIEFGLASQEQIVDLGFTHVNSERNLGAVGTVCPATIFRRNSEGPVKCTSARRPRNLREWHRRSYCSLNTSRIFRPRVADVNGLCRKAMPGLSTPWCTMASSV